MSNESIKLGTIHIYLGRIIRYICIKTVQHFLDLRITMFYFDRFTLAILAFMKLADH